MSSLAGTLHLRPGTPVPHNLRSTRQAWAARVAPGRPASALPALLAGLFSLCGHAHRSASQLAIGAADPALCAAAQAVPAVLQRETALEHLRRMGLDWPRLLAAPDAAPAVAAQAGQSLRRCPLMAQPTGPADWAAVRQWLQDDLLQMPAADWLHAWQRSGADWLGHWSQRHGGWLPRLLRAAHALDMPLPEAPALRVHAQTTGLQALGAALALRPGFALQPHWQGQAAHTGPWARLNQGAPAQTWTTWALLGSRLAELVRLCLPDAPDEAGAGTLAWGALRTGERQGLSWVEMARGLLIHQVALTAGPGQAAVVQACQVLAPTEWNFHPDGVVAQALAAWSADTPDPQARVALLMAALDPCVPFEIAAQAANPESQEATHA